MSETMRERVAAKFRGKVYGSGYSNRARAGLLTDWSQNWSLTGEEIVALYDALAEADERIQSRAPNHASLASRVAIETALSCGSASRKADAALGKLKAMGAIEYVSPPEHAPVDDKPPLRKARTRRWQITR